MDWYYEQNGTQQGPVSEETLKSLYSSNTITSENLVWRAGMSNWAPYGQVFSQIPTPVVSSLSPGKASCPTCGAMVSESELIPTGDKYVCPHCRDRYAQGLREGLANPFKQTEIRGTGGMTPNQTLRAEARDTLAGNWGTAVLVTFLKFLVIQVCQFVPFAGVFIQYIIGGPLELGNIRYFMSLYRDEGPDVGTLFQGFSQFLRGLGLYFLVAIIVGLASLAAAAPGIAMILMAYDGNTLHPEESPLFMLGIFAAAIPATILSIYLSLRYALVYYIANDVPDLGVVSVLKQSSQLMDGFKGKLFMLYLSFIGWHILGALALGIGVLWSITYMQTAIAAFYDDLQTENP